MPVSLFEHKPQRCPFGHSLWPGQARVGWKPCICAAAQEGAERGRGMGHVLVSCQTCHAELCDATFYEPPHDIRCREAGPWLCLPAQEPREASSARWPTPGMSQCEIRV